VASLYLHIPFRPATHPPSEAYTEVDPGLHTSYVQALVREIAHYGDRYGATEPIDTLHVGGGTPSLLHVDDLQRVLQAVLNAFDAPLQEATLEVAPAHASADYLDSLQALGFTRVSLGVQSFYPDDRRALGFSPVADDMDTIVTRCHAAGFDSFSIDLAFGWAAQEDAYWAANLARAARLEVPHLTLAEVTDRAHTAPQDQISARYRRALDVLSDRGYEPYEIANFARPGHRSRQNEAYWSHANYLGLGASAHSFWWRGLPAYRWANVTPSSRYAALIRQGHAPREGREARSLDDLADEYVALRLRTRDGLDLDHLSHRYGLDVADMAPDVLDDLMEEGYLTRDAATNRLRLTVDGMLVCDAVTHHLLQALAIT